MMSDDPKQTQEAQPSFYNPELWRASCLDTHFKLSKIDFDEVEEAMIRQMSHKTGYPRSEIVRMAVRDFYHYNMIQHK